MAIFKIVTPFGVFFAEKEYLCSDDYTPDDAVHGSGTDAAAHGEAALPARTAHQEPSGTSGPLADDHRHVAAVPALRHTAEYGTEADGHHTVGDAQPGHAHTGLLSLCPCHTAVDFVFVRRDSAK